MGENVELQRKTFVVDTNVLLTNPKFFSTVRDADVVLPHVVLAELDKVKTVRGDGEARFRGREVSRFLFDLSEKGDLTKGVAINSSSTIKIHTFEPGNDLPSALKNKTADDLIVALALHLSANSPVTLLTNDLNMLIKAQSLGLDVQRSEKEESRQLWSHMTRRWQTTIFPVLVVVLLAFIGLFMYKLVDWVQNPEQARTGQTQQQTDEANIRRLQSQLTGGPGDFRNLVALGDIYQKRHEWTQAALYFQRAVLLNSRDLDTRTNLAIAYFNSGRQSSAMQVLNQIATDDWSYAPAHYNLGAMYYTLARASKEAGREADAGEFFRRAEVELNVYLKLDPKGDSAASARTQLTDIKRQLTT